MKAFYNEIDRYCCDWLSNLMDAGEITPGTICDKSIEDVTPADVVGYERVHWFAGIGVLADADIHEQGRRSREEGGEGQEIRVRPGPDVPDGVSTHELGDATSVRRETARPAPEQRRRNADPEGPVNGFWANAEWIHCNDPRGARWRPIEPGTLPLVAGSDFSLGSGSAFEGKSNQKMVHAFGNSIVRQVAATFISAYMDETRQPR